jgi:hypothetical protein
MVLLGGACSADGATPAESRGTRGSGTATASPNAQPAAGSGSSAANSGTLVVANPNTNVLPPAQTGGVNTRPAAGSGACEVVQLVTEPVIPEMMIVLDRSGSMTDGGRWVPSVAAVRRVTQELQTKIHFGLALFPDPDASMSSGPVVNNITDCFTMPNPQKCIEDFNNGDDDAAACAPGKIFVPVAQNSAAMIGGVLDKTMPFGGTPTSETLQGILKNYGSGSPPLTPSRTRSSCCSSPMVYPRAQRATAPRPPNRISTRATARSKRLQLSASRPT